MRRLDRRSISAAVLLCSALASPSRGADGDLDTSFWIDGKMAFSAGDTDFGAVAVRANGDLVVGYSIGAGTPDGELAYWRKISDSSLGTPCRVEPIADSPEDDIDDRILDMTFDSSGRLLVLARSLESDLGLDSDFVVAYSFPGCQLDLTFGTNGKVQVTPFDLGELYGSTRLTTTGGKILVSGWAMLNGDFVPRTLVVRLEADGDFDPTFSSDGRSHGPTEHLHGLGLAVAPNGHIVMVAERLQFTVSDEFIVHEFGTDGTFLSETSIAFDLGGSNDDVASAIATTPDGRVVVVGKAAGDGNPTFSWAAMAVLSWDEQGELALDSSFSGDGKQAFRFGSRRHNSLSDVVSQGSSRIFVAGTALSLDFDNAMAVARIAPDGSFDGTFYPPGNGKRVVDFDLAEPEHDSAERLVLQKGKVVLGGQVDVPGGVTAFGLARLRNSPILMPDWDLP